jgi:hypothetical protein
MSPLPALLEALNDQQPALRGQPGITVRHENLRVGVGPRRATPQLGVLFTSRPDRRYQRPGRVHLGVVEANVARPAMLSAHQQLGDRDRSGWALTTLTVGRPVVAQD